MFDLIDSQIGHSNQVDWSKNTCHLSMRLLVKMDMSINQGGQGHQLEQL
jgi:hypothetical protein